MGKPNDFIACRNFIREFAEERLEGNLLNLIDFDFASLRRDIRFGCSGRTFDCDDTDLMRAIGFLLWGESFPALTFSDIGPGKKYRGDTLNTFNTVLGKFLAEQNTWAGIVKSNAPENLQEAANKFHVSYHFIGNYILLPNIAETDKKRAYTLNTYRGTAYKDYFDLFLIELEKSLTACKGDRHLINLIERNDFFFSWIKTNGGLAYFKKLCWLDDYFSPSAPETVFAPYMFCLRKRREWTDTEKADYIGYMGNYMLKATAIIKNRSYKMVERLAAICL